MRSLTTLIAAVCTLVSFALTTNIVVKDGIYFNEDGSLFSGEYEQFESGIKLATISVNNGLLSGSAVYYHANGAIKEEGTFVNGKRSGSWFQYTSSGELTSVAAFNNDKKEDETIKSILSLYPGKLIYLKTALLNFDQAAIFTIHGFCQRVLSENAFESGRLEEWSN